MRNKEEIKEAATAKYVKLILEDIKVLAVLIAYLQEYLRGKIIPAISFKSLPVSDETLDEMAAELGYDLRAAIRKQVGLRYLRYHQREMTKNECPDWLLLPPEDVEKLLAAAEERREYLTSLSQRVLDRAKELGLLNCRICMDRSRYIAKWIWQARPFWQAKDGTYTTNPDYICRHVCTQETQSEAVEILEVFLRETEQ